VKQHRTTGRPVNNSVRHSRCQKITRYAIATAFAIAHTEQLPETLPCAWCDGDFPLDEFRWVNGEKIGDTKPKEEVA